MSAGVQVSLCWASTVTLVLFNPDDKWQDSIIWSVNLVDLCRHSELSRIIGYLCLMCPRKHKYYLLCDSQLCVDLMYLQECLPRNIRFIALDIFNHKSFLLMIYLLIDFFFFLLFFCTRVPVSFPLSLSSLMVQIRPTWTQTSTHRFTLIVSPECTDIVVIVQTLRSLLPHCFITGILYM